MLHYPKIFWDAGTEDVFNGRDTAAARRLLPVALHRTAAKKIDVLLAAETFNDLRYPPGNRLHNLGGDRAGQWAMRINDRYRICFLWTKYGARNISIADYHR